MTPAALWTAAVATAAVILSLDLLLPLGAAGGVPYVLLVLLALKSPSRNTAFGLAAAGSLLTILGFFLSEPGAMLSVVLTNRAVALFAIWISVLPVVRYQRVRFGAVGSLRAHLGDAAGAPRQTQDLFQKAFHASPHPASLTRTSDRRVMEVNAAWLRVLGRTREEVIGADVGDFGLWVDGSQREEMYHAIRTAGRVSNAEATWRTKDGRHIDVLFSAERLDLDDGAVILVEAHDQTARKRAENALHESEERFTKAFQGAPLMMCIMNLENFEFIDANDAWLKGLRHGREDIIGQTSIDIPLWASKPRQAEAHRIFKKTGSLRGFEAKWRRSDDTIIDVRIHAELLDINGAPAILSIARDVTEEKCAEQALRQSEARFRDVAEISSDWIWESDASNRISYISDRVRDALGFDPKVVIGSVRGTSGRIADRGSEAWRRHLKEVESRRPFKNFVYQHYDREGGIRYIQISGKPVFGEDGEFMGYRGVGSDITRQREVKTARARAKQQRERARQRLQAVMDNVLEGIVTIDEGGLIETINPAGEELFGYTADDVVGRNVSILMPAGHGHRHDGYLAHFFRTGERRILEKPRELFARRRDGSEFPIELRVSEMRIGDSRKFVGAIRDLTERKNAEKAQRRSEEHLRAVIENSSDVISIVEADGTIRSESPALERMSGYSRGELKNRHIATLAHHDDRERVLAAFSRVVAEPNTVETVEYRARHKDGSWLTIESIAKNMLDNPVVNGVVVTSRDITEHKRAKDALTAAKEEAEYANRSKTEFLANMSHELRTPLNAVIGFAGMIEKELYGPLGSKKYKESAAYIDESATHLLNLINDLLDISKIEVGKMDMFEEDFEIGATVEPMLRMIEPRATQADVLLESRGFAGLPRLFADPRMLKQIVLNLVSNAVKFTPRGGSVVVAAEIEGGGALAITVRDTGIGIAKEDIPTALAPFGQIRTGNEPTCEGTGLGLPLAKSLIEMHGGEIEIDSTVGVGTTVTIRYPASRACWSTADGEILHAKAS